MIVVFLNQVMCSTAIGVVAHQHGGQLRPAGVCSGAERIAAHAGNQSRVYCSLHAVICPARDMLRICEDTQISFPRHFCRYPCILRNYIGSW